MKRFIHHLVFAVLTLMAAAAYGGAAWAASGGDSTWIVVLTIVLFVGTVWTGRNSLRI